MRHNIWEKDDFFDIDGKRIDMDAAVVQLPETASLWWMNNFSDPAGPYGELSDIRLEDGVISGELRVFDPTWDDETMLDLHCRLGGFYKAVKYHTEGEIKIVTSCELKAVSVMLLSQTPGWLPKKEAV